jgi:acyl carrier protein
MDDLSRVSSLLVEILDLSPDSITADTSTESVENWDSIQHLSLMLALEEEFDLRLDVEDLEALTSVAAILDFVKASRHPG